jgi:ubiquinone/menaquinone biosynthesis C-methylase UbiE
MDRRAWLDERRATVEATYDAEASRYDEHDPPIRSTHRHFVRRLLATCPPGGLVLDAPCGTGKYFGMVEAAGLRVVGVDQSAGMLAQARLKGVAVTLHAMGLQEIRFAAAFDAAMTIDAMENVPPEDWPVVLSNLHRAVRPGGSLYITVEEIPDREIERAYTGAVAGGLPAVRGEVIDGDTAGYHYYPGRERVLGWLGEEGLTVIEEAFGPEEWGGYRHFLLRSARADLPGG